MTNLNSSCGSARSIFSQHTVWPSWLSGHLISMILITGFGTAAIADMPAGFEHDRIATIQEGSHQRIDFFLFQRLPARHLHEFCRIASRERSERRRATFHARRCRSTSCRNRRIEASNQSDARTRTVSPRVKIHPGSRKRSQ